ncbi:MAG: 50S ribosomal protein L4 [bacterium]|nr:50S ribosomal protein L4 [bacterium]MDT8364969.1 50S ribosomal protein L4 [bacterium]
MPQMDILNIKNEVVGKVDLAPWWNEQGNSSLIHQAVVTARAGARRGTHSSKGRTDVRGGGAKPFRQKGTGRARQGTIRAPNMRGGGVVFGPHPRDYSKSMNKKMSRKALQNVLAHKAASESLLIVDDFLLEAPKTRELVAAMDRFDIISAVIVVDSLSEELDRASGNLKWVKIVTPDKVNTYDVLAFETLIVTRKALETLEGAMSR